MDTGGTLSSFDWGTLSAMGFAFTALGSGITWIFNRGGKAALLQQQVKDAQKAAKDAQDRADSTQKAYDQLLASLNQHMISDAASFAKLEAIAGETSRVAVASEVRLTGAIDNLGKRIDDMSKQFGNLAATLLNRFGGQEAQ